MLFTGMTSRSFTRSCAMPPQAMPPMLPGTTRVPRSEGGVKKPSARNGVIASRHQARSSSVSAPRLVRGQPRARERSRGRREGLRRRGLLARDVALRHRPLFDRNERRAGLAIEHEEVAGLGRHADGRDGAPVLAPVEQDRWRRDVVVPEIVMHGLEVPDALAGVGAQRHDGIGEQVVAEALAAVVVRARAARRDEDEIAGGIGDDHRPDIGGTGARGAAVLPGVRADRCRVLRDRIPAPLHRAGHRVEGRAPRRSARSVRAAVLNRRADDDGVADDGGRRRDLIVGEPGRRDAQPLPQIDDARGAEALNRPPGRASSAISRASIVATKMRRSRAALPHRHAAAGESP